MGKYLGCPLKGKKTLYLKNLLKKINLGRIFDRKVDSNIYSSKPHFGVGFNQEVDFLPQNLTRLNIGGKIAKSCIGF
jgi:hypothetical protein